MDTVADKLDSGFAGGAVLCPAAIWSLPDHPRRQHPQFGKHKLQKSQ
jgi:hypothetical protein